MLKGLFLELKYPIAEGIVEYIIECDVDTLLTGSKVDYESGMATVEGTSEEEVSVEILLTPIEGNYSCKQSRFLNPIYFDFDKSNITSSGGF